MDCINCGSKKCRSLGVCENASFNPDEVLEDYQLEENQKIVKVAASLVDDGRAGKLNRLQELVEFIKSMEYEKPGLAYCYGMEQDAARIKKYFKKEGIRLTTVSCTVGGMAQDEVNASSCIHKVSCNPLGQATQLHAEGVDFTIIMGICLGHDILLQRNLHMDFTTLVVKDRLLHNDPLKALEQE